MASVSIRKLKKSFGTTPVIRGVDIDIEDGEFLILVGPSGCGKSTLLRMIAGLEDISEGDILIGDQIVNQMLPKQRNIAMVFQNYALYPHMTVRENMAFSLKVAGVATEEVNAKVAKAAQILTLDALLDRLPRQLSGGQRQRVAMGRAIVRDPAVFLFDEPLSNLDAKLRMQMRTEIKSLHQRLGTTIVYVTHDQIEAMTMADRIVVLSDGSIEQIGTPLELYDRPDSLFVAGFIGSPPMNVFDGTIVNGAFLSSDGLRLPVPPRWNVSEGQALAYGVRPEHLVIDAVGFDVTVEVVEPTGSETQLVARAARHAITAVFRERISARPTDVMRLSAVPEHVHLFDRASGTRLAEA